MPSDLMPELEINRKKDLIDLYRNNEKAVVKNMLNGKVTLEKMTDNFLSLHSDSSSVEIILLPLINDSKVICITKTVCAPVCDSRIYFYTIDWKQLEMKDFFSPAIASEYIKENVDVNNIDFSMLDMDLFEYKLNPDDLTLKQTYNTPLYLDKDSRGKIKMILSEKPIVFRWHKTKFTKDY